MTKTVFKRYLQRDVWARGEAPVFTKLEFDASKSKFNINHRKEDKFSCGYKVLDSKFNTVIDVRFYYTASTCYCCLWINYKNIINTRGSDSAGGYGYDKKSSAFNGAILNCGFENFPCFNGSGCNEWALKVLCKIIGLKNFHIIEMFG